MTTAPAEPDSAAVTVFELIRPVTVETQEARPVRQPAEWRSSPIHRETRVVPFETLRATTSSTDFVQPLPRVSSTHSTQFESRRQNSSPETKGELHPPPLASVRRHARNHDWIASVLLQGMNCLESYVASTLVYDGHLVRRDLELCSDLSGFVGGRDVWWLVCIRQ